MEGWVSSSRIELKDPAAMMLLLPMKRLACLVKRMRKKMKMKDDGMMINGDGNSNNGNE